MVSTALEWMRYEDLASPKPLHSFLVVPIAWSYVQLLNRRFGCLIPTRRLAGFCCWHSVTFGSNNTFTEGSFWKCLKEQRDGALPPHKESKNFCVYAHEYRSVCVVEISWRHVYIEASHIVTNYGGRDLALTSISLLEDIDMHPKILPTEWHHWLKPYWGLLRLDFLWESIKDLSWQLCGKGSSWYWDHESE